MAVHFYVRTFTWWFQDASVWEALFAWATAPVDLYTLWQVAKATKAIGSFEPFSDLYLLNTHFQGTRYLMSIKTPALNDTLEDTFVV